MFRFVPAASHNGHFQLSGLGLKKMVKTFPTQTRIPALYDLMTQALPLVTSNSETFFAASIRHLEYVLVNLKCERRSRLAECLKAANFHLSPDKLFKGKEIFRVCETQLINGFSTMSHCL
jgi:hypothetical protein